MVAETAIPQPLTAVRYTFRGTLLLTGALHIGSGAGGSFANGQPPTDATVVRDSLGFPYIPGSSLRGALRSAVLQVAPLLLDAGRAALDDDEASIERRRQQAEAAVEAARKAAPASASFDAEGELQRQLDRMLSPAERLFGTTLWSSPLQIPDLHLAANKPHDGEVRHGVGIDRDTGAARDKIKYDFEVLPRGLRFNLLMRCEMPAAYRADWEAMLAIGLRLFEQGEITLGGRAARGVGQVRLEPLVVSRLDLTRTELLARLRAGAQAGDGIEQPNWVQQQLDALATKE
jgi:CRISPR-associated RAMP protein (TIGR02581 family)